VRDKNDVRLNKARGAAAAIAIALAAFGVAGTDALGTPQPAHSTRVPCPKPGDPIAIQSVWISANPIHRGTSVSGTVVATCNVAAVTVQAGTYRIGMPKVSPGVFKTTVYVPWFVWPGKFSLVVTAIRTDGATVTQSMPIVVSW